MVLTRKQRVFVEEYLTCWNASEAARRAGYKSKANVIGSQLLANPSIADEVRRRIAEKTMKADEALVRLAEQARGSMGDFLSVVEVEVPAHPLSELARATTEGEEQPEQEEPKTEIRQYVRLDLVKAAQAGKLHLIKKYAEKADGVTIELYSAQSALDLLLQHYKAGPKGTADDPIHQVTMSMDEWRAERDRRRQQAEQTLAEFESDDA